MGDVGGGVGVLVGPTRAVTSGQRCRVCLFVSTVSCAMSHTV